MIKKILIAIVCLFCANTVSAASMFDLVDMRITDTAALQSILEKWFPNNIEIRAKIAGYALENVKAGKSTNPAVLCELASMKDKTQCRNFIADIVWGATGFYVSACKSGASAPQGGEIVCNTLFHMLNVQQSQAVSLIKELDRLSIGNGLVCESGWNTRNNDDFIRCKSTKNKRVFYEFKLDDVRESFVDTVMESVRQGIFRIYGIDDYTDYYPEMSIEKCNSMKSSAAVFGLEPRLHSERSEFLGIKKPKSGNTFCALEQKRSGPLSSVCNISNFVFCKDLQPNMDVGFMDYLSSYTAEKCQISPEQIKCEVGIRKYYGDKCNSSMFNPSDDIVSCNVPGKGYIDYVFDDVTEFSKVTSNAGKQGMACVVLDGTYNGKECMHLTKERCEQINDGIQKNCSNCEKAYWDANDGICRLPDAAYNTESRDRLNNALLVVGTVAGVVITVVSGGAGAPVLALVLIETTGAVIEGVATHNINEAIDEFFGKSNSCNTEKCAVELINLGMQRIVDFSNDIKNVQIDAFDKEMARLFKIIPEDSEVFQKILNEYNGDLSYQANAGGIFDAKSWQPEQVWRAVGVTMQLASIFYSVADWMRGGAKAASEVMEETTDVIRTRLTRAQAKHFDDWDNALDVLHVQSQSAGMGAKQADDLARQMKTINQQRNTLLNSLDLKNTPDEIMDLLKREAYLTDDLAKASDDLADLTKRAEKMYITNKNGQRVFANGVTKHKVNEVTRNIDTLTKKIDDLTKNLSDVSTKLDDFYGTATKTVKVVTSGTDDVVRHGLSNAGVGAKAAILEFRNQFYKDWDGDPAQETVSDYTARDPNDVDLNGLIQTPIVGVVVPDVTPGSLVVPNGGNGGTIVPNGGNGGTVVPNGGNGGTVVPNGGNGGTVVPNGGNGDIALSISGFSVPDKKPVALTPKVSVNVSDNNITPHAVKDPMKTGLIATAAVLGAVGAGALIGGLVSNDKKDDDKKTSAVSQQNSVLEKDLETVINNSNSSLGVFNGEGLMLLSIPTENASNAKIVNIAGNAVVVVSYHGHNLPYYLNAQSGAWMPLLGVGKTGGWFNIYLSIAVPTVVSGIQNILNQKLNPRTVVQFVGNNPLGVQFPRMAVDGYRIVNKEFPDGVVEVYNGQFEPSDRILYNNNYTRIKSII